MNSELIITAREGASMAGERTYSIGEVAELLGLAPSTIRFYDNKGLLPNVERSEGGVRRFSESDIDWLRMIEHLKMSGMTIAEIGEYIALFRKGDATIEQRRALVHGRRDEILRQMAELQETLDFITYKCWYYDTAAEAGTCDVPRNMPEDEMPPEMAAILKKCHIRSRH